MKRGRMRGREAEEFAQGHTALQQHCQSPTPWDCPQVSGMSGGCCRQIRQAGPAAAGYRGRAFHLSLFFFPPFSEVRTTC